MTGRWQKYLEDALTLPFDAARAWQNDRWRGVWDAIAIRSVYRFFRSGRLVVYAQPVGAARDIAAPPGVSLIRLQDGDWPALERFLTARDYQRFRELHARGHRGIVAWRGRTPIGYAWVALHIDPVVTECPLPLPDHAAYLWDLFVTPTERSSGVGSALASARLRAAREWGRTEGWRMIEASNHASLRTLAKSAGATHVIGVMRFRKIGSRMHAHFERTPEASPGTA
jgi:GNAT superfamily N-acetyltransferase